MRASKAEVSQHILRFTQQRAGVSENGDPESSLYELGLDSLAIVALIVDLEKTFSISFPAQMISSEVFGTANSAAAAVAELQQAAVGQ